MRLPEWLRIRRVDDYGDSQLATLLPNGIQAWVVDSDSFTVNILIGKTKTLVHLQPLGSVFHIFLELGNCILSPFGIVYTVEVQIGKDGKSVWIGLFHIASHRLQLRAAASAEVNHDSHIHGIHFYDTIC